MQRVKDEYIICEWGCGDWVQRGHDQIDHQLNRCIKRMLPCALGCTVKMSEEDWLKPCYVKTEEELLEERLRMSIKDHQEKEDDILTVQQNHEENECVKRLVNCPRQCLEWVCFEVLDRHLTGMLRPGDRHLFSFLDFHIIGIYTNIDLSIFPYHHYHHHCHHH